MPINKLSRGTFLHSVGAATALSASGFAEEPGGKIWQIDKVQFSQIHGPSEQDQRAPGLSFLQIGASASRLSA
jgi:hypothetical protein